MFHPANSATAREHAIVTRRLAVEFTLQFLRKIRLAAILEMGLALHVPSVSVILPTCDRPALLSRAVESVLMQTEKDLEVIIVDNNRNTAPINEVSFAWRSDPRIRVIESRSARNAASARNVGLAEARGDWIAYLDDDDAFRPEKLRRQMARAGSSPIVLCGAMFHLRNRTRPVQVSAEEFSGDELLNRASWGTPLLMHRRRPEFRFDEELFAGEDVHFAQGIISAFGVVRVPVAAEPLVDVYQDRQDVQRTNIRAIAGWSAARRTWYHFGSRYSSGARRLFVLRALIARAKLNGESLRCVALATALLRLGGGNQARFALNAVIVSTGLARGRWVT
jgi:glycosyltransferase involved in cell wall biosynthesis